MKQTLSTVGSGAEIMFIVLFVLFLPGARTEEEAMRGRVLSELRRSMDEYPTADVSSFFSDCWNKAILVVENRVFVSAHHVNLNKHKAKYHLEFLLSLVSSLPNFVYLFEESAKGTVGDERKCVEKSAKLPIVVIAKQHGYRQHGILAPNPYFRNITSFSSSKTKMKKESVSWSLRDDRCVWRGSVIAKDCKQDFGNHARFCAVVRASQRPDLLDAKAVGHFEPRQVECEHLAYDSHMRASVNRSSLFLTDFMDPNQFSTYKYVLNLPGVMGGSYSRNLNHLWSTGAVVLLWHGHHVEWYYPALRTNETHLEVGCDTILHALEDLRRPNRYAANNTTELRIGAKRLHDAFISPQGLEWYMLQLAHAHRSYYENNSASSLDDRSRRRKLFEKLDCANFDLLEVTVRVKERTRKTEATEYEREAVSVYQLSTISPTDPAVGMCAQPDAIAEDALKAKLLDSGVVDPKDSNAWVLVP